MARHGQSVARKWFASLCPFLYTRSAFILIIHGLSTPSLSLTLSVGRGTKSPERVACFLRSFEGAACLSVRIHFKIADVSSSSRAEQTDFPTDALQIIIVGKLFLETLNLNWSTYTCKYFVRSFITRRDPQEDTCTCSLLHHVTRWYLQRLFKHKFVHYDIMGP